MKIFNNLKRESLNINHNLTQTKYIRCDFHSYRDMAKQFAIVRLSLNDDTFLPCKFVIGRSCMQKERTASNKEKAEIFFPAWKIVEIEYHVIDACHLESTNLQHCWYNYDRIDFYTYIQMTLSTISTKILIALYILRWKITLIWIANLKVRCKICYSSLQWSNYFFGCQRSHR